MSKKLDVPQSGKLGTTVNVRTRYGQIQRQYVVPKDPKTPNQTRVRANLGFIAARWRALTQEQRNAWTLAAQDEETRRRLGRAASLTGFQFFMRINCRRAALGLDQFDLPPALVQFGANPVGGLSAYLSRGEVVLELAVSGTPVQYTVVCAAAPCSPGRSFVVHFNIIGFLPDPEDGVSNIADLYVARYGPIPAPSRIFVRTYQHIDGWEDLPKQTTAIVPRR